MKKSLTMFCLAFITATGSLMAQNDNPMSDPKAMQPGMPQNDMQSKNNMTMQKNMGKGMMMPPDLSSWPEASRMAVQEITTKYGEPNGVTPDELIWMNKGAWKKICISKMESKHNFPIEHTDMMAQTISYKVPEKMMDELGMFDGSVTFDRTQGTMTARCDKEANNMLALNLANDIITGKKTVEEARKSYGNMVKEKMNGGNPDYMQHLTFSSQPNAADPDKNTTGLTKKDVMKGMKKSQSEQ